MRLIQSLDLEAIRAADAVIDALDVDTLPPEPEPYDYDGKHLCLRCGIRFAPTRGKPSVCCKECRGQRPHNRPCRTCGKGFRPIWDNSERYCSDRCLRLAPPPRVRAERPVKTKTGTCKWCDESFTVVTSDDARVRNQVYCSPEHAVAARRQYKREAERARRAAARAA